MLMREPGQWQGNNSSRTQHIRAFVLVCGDLCGVKQQFNSPPRPQPRSLLETWLELSLTITLLYDCFSLPSIMAKSHE